MVTFAPIGIVLGVIATAGVVSFLFWDAVASFFTGIGQRFKTFFERSGIKVRPEELVVGAIAVSAIVWTALVVLLHPPVWVDALLLPLVAAAAFGTLYLWVIWSRQRRLEEFVSQLELALRLIASGLRVGLGLRQAINQVAEELPDPARYEFARVMGETNIGVSIVDAMDDLAKRMPGNETLMMARAMRVQTQTGGDLATLLDHLSNTIRDRRRLVRKAAALTAEGRMSANILELIPPFLVLFIVFAQPEMGRALLFTTIGHYVLVTLAILEIAGFAWLQQLLRLEV